MICPFSLFFGQLSSSDMERSQGGGQSWRTAAVCVYYTLEGCLECEGIVQIASLSRMQVSVYLPQLVQVFLGVAMERN